jgi:multidrug efflux pump subunit AcrA (membrane-fusion protein)
MPPVPPSRQSVSVPWFAVGIAGSAPSFVAALLALAFGAAACSGSSAEKPRNGRAEGTTRQVRVVPAAEESLVRSIAVTGTLAAEEQVTLSMKVTGRLNELLVDLGSRVTQGQTLAKLVPTDFNLRVNQARAALLQARARLGLPPNGEDEAITPENTAIVREARAVLDEAKLTNDRAQTFVKEGIGTRADQDRAYAALKVAESRYQDALEEVSNRQAVLQQRRSELELAEQAVRDSNLTAPLDGMVRERHATVGQYLAAGTPVVTVVRMHPLRLRLAVPERAAPTVRVKQDVRVVVEGDPTVHSGRIARVSPAIDESSRTLMVEAEVPNQQGQLRPGSFANAEIVLQTQDKAVVVPASALVTFAGVDKVLVVKDGKSLEKRVSTGRRDGERIEIVSGLDAGEQVIVDPGNLVGGEPVSVANASNRTAARPAPAVAR